MHLVPEVYLDNSATTRVRPEVVKAMVTVMEQEYGNPSTAYRRGQRAEQLVKKARRQIAHVFQAEPEEIYFTSGGTESNNWAIMGAVRARARRGKHLVTTMVEHPSVLAVFRFLEEQGYSVTYVPVNEHGAIDTAALAGALSPETILVSTMYVNNEVGAIMPLADIAQLIKQQAPQAMWHVDAVQGFAKLPLFPHDLGIDLVSLSGHKIQGPKGIGALFIRRGLNLPPLILGGGQENGLRSGTENVPGIVGLGLAAALLWEQQEHAARHMANLKQRLRERLLKELPDTFANGPQDETGAPHILGMSFPGVKGEVLLHALEDKGICVSTGSACSSHQAPGSHVLKALGLSPDRRDSAIRFSLSPENTLAEMDYTVDCLKEIVPELRRIMAR